MATVEDEDEDEEEDEQELEAEEEQVATNVPDMEIIISDDEELS